jgi:hypothetical protein
MELVITCYACSEIRGFHGDEDYGRGLLGCDAMLCCGRIPAFRLILLPQGGGSKISRNVCIRGYIQKFPD